MKTTPIDDASRYLSRLATEIRTPLQRLQNLKVMTKVVSDVANRRVSAEIGKLVIDHISALDTKAEEHGVPDPMCVDVP